MFEHKSVVLEERLLNLALWLVSSRPKWYLSFF